MSSFFGEKLSQASQLVAESSLDAWLVFVRETAEGSDPVLPYLIEGSLTWISALIIFRTGLRVAIVGNYDQEALQVSANWNEVIPYVQDIRPVLLETLDQNCPDSPRIGVNFSMGDEKCDGLSHGMFLLLEKIFEGTRFKGTLESAEGLCMALRGRKTQFEVDRMMSAIVAGDELFAAIPEIAGIGVSELQIFTEIQARMGQLGLGFAWDRTGDPIVNTGPASMVGHGIPSNSITVQEGHILHIDLGVVKGGYSSDIQRCWYVGSAVPDDVSKAFVAVWGAIQAAYGALRPGVEGWQVDRSAREFIVDAGYPEYLHAVGHQVGRVAHDGGALLGPKWERYGDRPTTPISIDEIYTLELGVMVPGRGYLGLEEMVRIQASGATWLSRPQSEMWLLDSHSS